MIASVLSFFALITSAKRDVIVFSCDAEKNRLAGIARVTWQLNVTGVYGRGSRRFLFASPKEEERKVWIEPARLDRRNWNWTEIDRSAPRWRNERKDESNSTQRTHARTHTPHGTSRHVTSRRVASRMIAAREIRLFSRPRAHWHIRGDESAAGGARQRNSPTTLGQVRSRGRARYPVLAPSFSRFPPFLSRSPALSPLPTSRAAARDARARAARPFTDLRLVFRSRSDPRFPLSVSR